MFFFPGCVFEVIFEGGEGYRERLAYFVLRATLEYFHPCDVGFDCMAKARPRDLAEEGVQGGVRQEGHEGPEGLGGLQEGGHGGLQEGVQGRSGDGRGVEPALDNHLTGTLGEGESHIGIICIALHLNLSSCCSWQLLQRCIVARSMPHRTVTHHMSGNI